MYNEQHGGDGSASGISHYLRKVGRPHWSDVVYTQVKGQDNTSPY